MRYPIAVKGLEGLEVVVETGGLFSGPKVLVDGRPAQAGPAAGQFLIERSDHTFAVVQLKARFLDPVPQVLVDGVSQPTAPSLAWYHWVWVGLPLVLVAGGGCAGGALGGLAVGLNMTVFRSSLNTLAKYLITGMLSVMAVGGYVAIVVALHVATVGPPGPAATPPSPGGAQPSGTIAVSAQPGGERFAALRNAPEAQRKDLFLQALLEATSPQDRSTLRDIFGDRAFPVDAGVLGVLEKHIAGIENESERKRWQSTWAHKVCAHAASLPRDWVVPRLLALAQEPNGAQSEALLALLTLHEGDQIAGVFPRLAAERRRVVLRGLTEQWRKERSLAGTEKLAELVLKDADPKVRRDAFQSCCESCGERPEVRGLLAATLRQEQDAAVRKDESFWYVNMLGRVRRSLTTQDYLELATSGPCQNAVKEAMEMLAKDYRNRAAHAAMLADRFAAIASTDNRAWLLLELQPLASHKLPETAKLYDLGLADADAAVREAAMAGRLSSLHELGPESDRLLKAIQSEKDEAFRKRMVKAYNLWQVRPLEGAARARTTRADGMAKLLELAASGDDELATAALKALPPLRKEERGQLTALQAIFGGTKADECKSRILSVTSGLEVDTILPLFTQALADGSVSVRSYAFSLLVQGHARADERVLKLLQETADREPDAGAKRIMQNDLKRFGAK